MLVKPEGLGVWFSHGSEYDEDDMRAQQWIGDNWPDSYPTEEWFCKKCGVAQRAQQEGRLTCGHLYYPNSACAVVIKEERP